MPFIFLGLFILTIGVLFYRWGKRAGSVETRNGALGIILAGLLLILLGAALLFTGGLNFKI